LCADASVIGHFRVNLRNSLGLDDSQMTSLLKRVRVRDRFPEHPPRRRSNESPAKLQPPPAATRKPTDAELIKRSQSIVDWLAADAMQFPLKTSTVG
jgi:hypothetical protein